MRQTSFFETQSMEHGGSLRVGKRKTARPICTRRPMHIVYRSELAIGAHSFRKPAAQAIIVSCLTRWSKHFGIKIHKYSVNSNHLHIALQGGNRRLIQNFLRVFAGQVAIRLLKLWRVPPVKVWALRVYSRICASFGRPFAILLDYIEKNINEAAGNIAYTTRTSKRRARARITSRFGAHSGVQI